MDSIPHWIENITDQANQAKLNSDMLTAADRGHNKLVKSLILQKADVNAMGKYGHTPLIEASLNNHSRVVDVLLNNPRTFINKKAEFGRTALMYAAQKGYLKVVESLLSDSNLLVNQADDYGSTALMEAVNYAHIPVIEKLITYREIAINQENEDGDNALQIAINRKKLYLIKGKAREEEFNKYEAIVKILRSKGAMLPKNSFQEKGFPIELQHEFELSRQLLTAAKEGDLAQVQTLITAGANICIENEYGETALMKATQYNHIKTCEYLIANAPLLMDKPDSEGRTPLMWAAKNGYNEIAFKLLDQNKTLLANQQDIDGNNALILACKHNHIQIVQRLIDMPGIRLNHANQKGKTAIELAYKEKNEDIVKLLKKSGIELPKHLKQMGPQNRSHSAQKRSRRMLNIDVSSSVRSKSLDPKDARSEREYQEKRNALNIAYLGAKKKSKPSISPLASTADLSLAALSIGGSHSKNTKGMKNI